MEHNELKPCPFCGGKAVLSFERILVGFGETDKLSFVKCNVCGIKGKAYGRLDANSIPEREKKAIEAWNRRANDGT